MIQGLDHVAVAVADLEAAVAAYEVLLGRRCQWRDEDDGAAHAWFRLANMALCIEARTGPGRAGERIRNRLATSGEGPGRDRLHGGGPRRGATAPATPRPCATHARLVAAGKANSDVRTGRRPGTRVFTIKDRSARLPTLVLGKS